VKRWKVAISLAIAAALIAPLSMGTWRLNPGGWRALIPDERERLARMATETDNCAHLTPPITEDSEGICMILLSDLHAGGHYESGERITWGYVGKNAKLMGMASVLTFLAAMILPSLGKRYWVWLKK
jgi:hypothetical protein